MFFHSRSRSREFLGMIASDSHSRIVGMDFFIPFPFPNYGNGFFSFPSRSRILGIDFFIPFPFPNFGNGFFNSLPVPELREWNYPISIPVPVPERPKVIPAHPCISFVFALPLSKNSECFHSFIHPISKSHKPWHSSPQHTEAVHWRRHYQCRACRRPIIYLKLMRNCCITIISIWIYIVHF